MIHLCHNRAVRVLKMQQQRFHLAPPCRPWRPAGTSGRIALLVAGGDKQAKAIVLKLVDDLGFNAVDAGSLDESWRQQPGTPVYTMDFDAEGVRRALSEARNERTPDWRATPKSPGTFTAPA
jgi:hypothetical protein